jgi:IS1 family transposase
LDELFWCTDNRKEHENGINIYIMTMVSREPRQIVAFEVANAILSKHIQGMVDRSPEAKNYYTDGGVVYLDVIFWGKHRRNIRNKSDTHIIEGSNSDIRHYIAGLRRKSRCFFRSLETLEAVLTLFINAYNKFGAAKHAFKERHPDYGRDFPFNHLRFI